MTTTGNAGRRRGTGLAASAAIACLTANTFWLYSNISHVIAASGWVERKAAVQYDLSRIEVALLNAETGQRGYILTGSASYLQPYYAGEAAARQLLAHVEDISDTNPALEDLHQQLDELIALKFGELAETIGLMTLQGQGPAREQVAADVGKRLMDDIRGVIDEMHSLNDAALAERQAEQTRAQMAVYASLGAFVVGTLILITLLYGVMRRELRQRIHDAAEIETYANSLNRSVADLKAERNEIRGLNEAAGYMQSCDTVAELSTMLSPILERMFADFDGQVLVHAPSRNRLDSVVTFGAPASGISIAPSDCWGLRRGQDHVHLARSASPLCAHVMHDRPDDTKADTLCMPLVAHGDTIGLLSMTLRTQDSGDAGEIMAAALRTAERLATQLGLTLANLRLRDSLRQQAIRDPLTDAFNRRYLDAIGDKILAQASRFGQQLAVVMLDVDHFKKYNDLHGHVAGDHALIGVAHVLQARLRETDWLFRYGGEEFLIIMQGLDASDASEKLDDMRAEIAELPFKSGDTVLPSVTISLGCALYPGQGETLAELITLADEALYESKRSGRNRLHLAQPVAPALIVA